MINILLSFTALVEKIYQAQKERDAAMNARLQMAHSEREELLDKLRRSEREHTGYILVIFFFFGNCAKWQGSPSDCDFKQKADKQQHTYTVGGQLVGCNHPPPAQKLWILE